MSENVSMHDNSTLRKCIHANYVNSIMLALSVKCSVSISQVKALTI